MGLGELEAESDGMELDLDPRPDDTSELNSWGLGLNDK